METSWTSSGNYAFNLGDEAIMESGWFDPDNAQITFYHHVLGAHAGQLFFEYMLPDGNWVTILHRDGQFAAENDTHWHRAAYNLSSLNFVDKIKIRFRVKAAGGFLGDIAIDEVVIKRM